MRFIPVCRCTVTYACNREKPDEEECAGCMYLDFIEEQPLAGLGKQ